MAWATVQRRVLLPSYGVERLAARRLCLGMMWRVEVVDERTHRVLAYLDALNRHGVRPPRVLVNEFAESPEQKFTSESVFSAAVQLRTVMSMFDERLVASETFCQYMARLGWVNDDVAAAELTPVGRALLKALNAPVLEEASADVFEVVLSPDNPFAYAQALNGLSSVEDALLVEPYFRLEQLMDVAAFDNVVRVLTGTRLKRSDYELLATGLASLLPERRLEVRRTADLHDRYLIPAGDGAVLMLGASLGGIGKNVSTMTTLGQVASQALRDAHERLWRDAEHVEPKQTKTLAPPAPVEEATPAHAPAEVPAKKAQAARKAAAKKSRSQRSS